MSAPPGPQFHRLMASDAFLLDLAGTSLLRYTGDHLSVILGCEIVSDEAAVYPLGGRWSGRVDERHVTILERTKVVSDIREALQSLGYRVAVIPPGEDDWRYYLEVAGIDSCRRRARSSRGVRSRCSRRSARVPCG